MPQEIVGIHQAPDLIDAFVADTGFSQRLARLLLLFDNQLLAVEWILEPMPQRAPRQLVEVAEQLRFPRIP